MREWLLHSEWCDVRLLCKGRVFSAHRAVLASVSSYLRCLLISHTEQETPIYIVLPDFDCKAMSSVLYYMYNGEINVPIGDLSSFFEIIRTLKIFVDQDALDNVKYHDDNLDIDIKEMIKDCFQNKEEISTSISSSLDSIDDLVKLEYRPINCLSSSGSNSHSSGILSEEESQNELSSRHNQLPYLERMQMEYGDLQKKVLRDPFTESYTQNSCAKKPTADVPEITNKRYHYLPSDSATNVDNAVTDTVQETKAVSTPDSENKSFEAPSLETIIKYFEINKSINNLEGLKNQIKGMSAHEIKMLYSLCVTKNYNLENEKSDCSQLNNKSNKHRPIPTLVPITKSQTSDLIDLSKSISKTKINTPATSVRRSVVKEYSTIKNTKDHERINRENKKSIKVRNAPLNKVLGNPWNTCQPRSYRPITSKHRILPRANEQIPDTATSDTDINIINDDNNNIHRVTQSPTGDAIESSAENSVPYTEDPESTKTNFDGEVSSAEETSGELKSQSAKPRHRCTDCGKSFSQLRNYKYHLSVHRGTREFAATCTVCGKYFNDKGYLSSHMKIHRNRKEYQCPHCPKSFNQRVAYNMHIRIHTGVKPHVCGECGKAFSRKMLLKQHQRTHSGERPYACSFCEKRFADRSNMTLHMRLHSGVKPFTCTLCQKSFTKKHHLKTHLNYHTGEKPYSCPRCNMAFSQSSNMRTHLKKCTAEAETT